MSRISVANERDAANLPVGDAERPQFRWTPWLIGLLKIAFTIAIMGFVFYTVDLSAAWNYAVEQNPMLLVAAAGIIVLQILCGALRWYAILRQLGAAVGLLETARAFYVAAFFNTCLWSSVGGDIARGWLAYRARVNLATTIKSVVLDHVAALVGIAIIVILTAPWFVVRVGDPIAALIPALLAALGLIGIAVVAQLDRMPAWTGRGARVLAGLQQIGAGTRVVFLRPASALRVAGIAVVVQVLMALSAYTIAQSLKIDLSPLDCLVLLQPVILLAALPISIGGWGVRETAMITLLGFAGVPSSAALVLSVQLGLLTMLVSLPGGLLLFLDRKKPVAAAGP